MGPFVFYVRRYHLVSVGGLSNPARERMCA